VRIGVYWVTDVSLEPGGFMSNPGRFSNQRTRAIVSVSVVALVLGAAGVLGGVGFAKGSVSAAQAQYGKTVMCHKTHSKKNPSVTISVSNSAVPAHLRHGDTIGACVTTTTTTGTTATTTTTTTTTTTATVAATGDSGPAKGGHGKGGGKGGSKTHGPKK
jgi:hypothetical protein